MLVENFFGYALSSHSYATGGSNVHELWSGANKTADAVNLVSFSLSLVICVAAWDHLAVWSQHRPICTCFMVPC